MTDSQYFVVGTFDSPDLYILAFDTTTSTLKIVRTCSAKGSHSWLAINKSKSNLYATCWTEPPGLASYAVARDSEGVPDLEFLNFVPTKARSGYVAVSDTSAYSAGGPSGEIYAIDNRNGKFLLQQQALSFLDAQDQQRTETGQVLDFGGLRHGAHSADISPDGKILYVADIGRNCIWTSLIADDGSTHSRQKHVSKRSNDGPRHVWPHPAGRYVYCLQEHSSMVDVLEQVGDALEWRQGVRIIPKDKDEKNYWADEVRLSLASGNHPEYMFASTRGLENHTKGYVAAFKLDEDGLIADVEPLHIYQTPTSGGWANAIEPAPFSQRQQEYMVLTDSEEGLVFMLSFDGQKIAEAARVTVPRGGCATAQFF